MAKTFAGFAKVAAAFAIATRIHTLLVNRRSFIFQLPAKNIRQLALAAKNQTTPNRPPRTDTKTAC